MNNIQKFKDKLNLVILWDVLLSELHINLSNKNLVNNIKTIFEANINPFISRANAKYTIIELNKQFLSQVVLAVNRLFPNIQQEQHIKRITISNEDVSEPYKIEDIHALRQNDFEKELEIKRMEMENYMTPVKPKDLDFSDKNLDGKIKSMDSLIADKMAERNMEFELFQNSNYNLSEPEKWLRSTETSVKTEKQNYEKHPIINNNVKLLIEEVEEKSPKKVSWDDLVDKDTTINIFNKLKKQPIIDVNQNNDNNNSDKQYVEQKSIQLPNVKQEEIIRNQSTLALPNNEPIIPKTEIIKQLNEMNKKIDGLYEMISKLTNIVEKNSNIEYVNPKPHNEE